MVFVLVGCAKPALKPPTQPALDYPHAYKALMVRYRDKMQELAARPLPPKSLPLQQRRTAAAQQAKDIADANADYARQLHLLKPPAEFAETHAASEAMLKVAADDNYQWAEAILHSDRATRARLLKEEEANELKAAQRLQKALKQAGGGAKPLDSLVNELKQGTGR